MMVSPTCDFAVRNLERCATNNCKIDDLISPRARALLIAWRRLFGGNNRGGKVAWINRGEDSRLLESVRHWTGYRKAIAQ